MLDFIKLIIYSENYADYLFKHPLLSFNHGSYNKEALIFESTYHGIKFEIRHFIREETVNTLVIISGSIHKYKNNGDHNHDDFTFSEMVNAIHSLCSLFQIDLKKANVQSPEIGVNIHLGYEPDRSLLKRLIVMHGDGGSKPPVPLDSKDLKGFKRGVRFNSSSQYGLKCYVKENKALRIEGYIDKMQKLEVCPSLKDIDFHSLFSYCSPQNIRKLFNVLVIEPFDKILIDESVDRTFNGISDDDFIFYQSCMKFDYWNDNHNKMKKLRDKQKVNQLQTRFGNYNIKEKIRNQLIEKLEECLANVDDAYSALESLQNQSYLVHDISTLTSDKLPDYHSIYCKWVTKLHNTHVVSNIKNGQDYTKIIKGCDIVTMNCNWYINLILQLFYPFIKNNVTALNYS